MARPPEDRRFFLRNSAEIERVKRAGRRIRTPLFNFITCRASSSTGHSRIGIVVGKRLGTAVTRNRAKRLFRELARQCRRRLAGGYDCLVFPRREALGVRHDELRQAWVSVLEREGLISSSSEPCSTSV
jgi:ribonuclease P protein component